MIEYFVRHVRPEDRADWLRMRLALYPDFPPEQIESELAEYLQPDVPGAVLVAAGPGGTLVGFIEISQRDWAHGCETKPVAYIESWYVDPEHRKAGVGRRLVEGAESWARHQGFAEMGSDCDLDNNVSYLAHIAMGYTEFLRHIHFAKQLDG
jgi:aminoglycoside 6'-N-acetyltransferase I